MKQIKPLSPQYSRECDIIGKVNELVERVNNLAKPLLVCKLAQVNFAKYEGDITPLIDRFRKQVETLVNQEYHVLVVVDSTVTQLTFEIHNQQSEVRKEFITQLENLKVEQNG